MKNVFKLLIITLCCAAISSLTACLNSDDDDNSIDTATQKQYQTYMSGSYSGKMYFYKTTGTNAQSPVKYDSLSATCYVQADSTMQLRAYDSNGSNKKIINCLDSAIVVSSSNSTCQPLFEALRDADAEANKVSMYYNIPTKAYVQTNSISFINTMLIEKKLTYSDKEHYVYFWFEPYTYGTWTSSPSRTLQTVMYLRNIYVADTRKDINQLGSVTPLSSSYFRQIFVALNLKSL